MRPMPGLRVSHPALELHAYKMPGATISQWVGEWVVRYAEALVDVFAHKNSAYTLARDIVCSCVVDGFWVWLHWSGVIRSGFDSKFPGLGRQWDCLILTPASEDERLRGGPLHMGYRGPSVG